MPRRRTVGASRGRRRAVSFSRTGPVAAHLARNAAQPDNDAEVSRLQAEVRRLNGLAASQGARISEPERELDAAKAMQPEEVIEIREIGKEQAREEIVESFKSGEPLDHADLADALALEISLVVEVCNELMEEGVIVFYDDDRG